MLQYGLTENLLTEDPNDYCAVTQNVRSYTDDEILDMMVSRGTTITRTDVKAVLNLYKEVITDLVADGNAINTELVNVSPSIAGVFTSATDAFDASRHKVKVNITAGTTLKKAGERIVTQKVVMSGTVPRITEAADVNTGAINTTLTPGGVLRLTGINLKFMPQTESNGVYFIDVEKGTEQKCTVVVDNKPSLITVVMPALAPGNYYVEVRSTYSQPKESKTLKTGRFNKTLTVNAAS